MALPQKVFEQKPLLSLWSRSPSKSHLAMKTKEQEEAFKAVYRTKLKELPCMPYHRLHPGKRSFFSRE